MKDLPIYLASVDEEGTGMFVVSLVSDPAVEVSWQLFDKAQELFKVENPDKQLITGVVMLADTPIYRYNPEYGEYYIKYTKDTIEKMVQKFFKENNQENVDQEHSFELIDGIELQQAFIKDTEKGINPTGFEKVPDGSLFFTYKVTSDELWEQVKSGSWTGFSLAGVFDIKQAFSKHDDIDETDVEENEILEMIEKLRNHILR